MTTAPAFLRKNGHLYTRCPVDGCENYKDYQAATCRKHCNQAGANNHHAGHYKTGHLMTNYERKTAYYSRNPEIKRAHTAVYRAVKAGKLIKPDRCYICGSVTERLEAHHHHGYDKAHWLDVVWPCYACHRELHMREGKDMATWYGRNRFEEGIVPEAFEPVVNLETPESDDLYWRLWVLGLRRDLEAKLTEPATVSLGGVELDAVPGKDILDGYMRSFPPAGSNKELYMQLKTIAARLASNEEDRYSPDEYSEQPANWRDVQ